MVSSLCGASWVALVVKNPFANAGDVRDEDLIPGSERSLEKGIATHPVFLPGELWVDEPGELQSVESQRVKRN